MSASQLVLEFHEAFNVPAYAKPSLPPTERCELRKSLIQEELKELCKAIDEGDLVGILDGLCDLLYVTYGTAWEFGLGSVLKEAIAVVHASNMSKLGEDGKPIYREDGKVLKGPNFFKPDLAAILKRYEQADNNSSL